MTYKYENGKYFIEGDNSELESLYFIKNFFDATSIPIIFVIITIVNYTWFNLLLLSFWGKILNRFEIYGLVEYSHEMFTKLRA